MCVSRKCGNRAVVQAHVEKKEEKIKEHSKENARPHVQVLDPFMQSRASKLHVVEIFGFCAMLMIMTLMVWCMQHEERDA